MVLAVAPCAQVGLLAGGSLRSPGRLRQGPGCATLSVVSEAGQTQDLMLGAEKTRIVVLGDPHGDIIGLDLVLAREHGAHVQLVKIPVADLATASAFYRDTLGLEEQFAVEEFGWAQYGTGGAPLCLYVAGKGGGAGTPGGETGVHLGVTDVAAVHAAIVARGGAPESIEEGADGSRFFEISDPDGNLLKVMESASSA